MAGNLFYSIAVCLLSLREFTRYHGVFAQTTALYVSMQNESGFIGWYMGPSTTQALTDPETWTTSGNYARGCPKTGACAYATDCQGNSITYDDGKTATCNQCRTMTIFEAVPYGTPTASNIFCANYWVAFTVFRNLPTATSTSALTHISTTASNSITTATATSSTSATASAASTISPNPISYSKPTQSNAPVIAGAVVGSVIGAAIIIAIAIWGISRRKNGPEQVHPTQLPRGKGQDPHREAFAPAQEMDSIRHPTVHELSSYR